MIKSIKIKEKRMNMEEIQDEKNLEKQRLKNALSDSLKELLKENDMKQKELAEKIGVSPTIVNAYYNAEKIPSVEIVYKIAEVFNVSMDWLYKRTENRDVSFKGIESMEFKTYADIMKCLFKMPDIGIKEDVIFGEERIINLKANSEAYEPIQEDVVLNRKVFTLLFKNEEMQKNIGLWKRLHELYVNGDLDKEEYNDIMDGKMKRQFNKLVGYDGGTEFRTDKEYNSPWKEANCSTNGYNPTVEINDFPPIHMETRYYPKSEIENITLDETELPF